MAKTAPPEGMPDPGQLSQLRNTARAVMGLPFAMWKHGRRQPHLTRSTSAVNQLSESPPSNTQGADSESQLRTEGSGELVFRSYSVDIVDADLSASELIDAFCADPSAFAPGELAGFVIDDEPAKDLTADDELVVEIPGPWNGPVRVVERSPTHLLLGTLEGHMEAGHVRFGCETADDVLRLTISSWARSGDPVFEFLHLRARIGWEIQTAMWVGVLERLVDESGGTRQGSVSVNAEILRGSDQ